MSEHIDNTLTAYLGPEFQLRLMWQLLVEPEFAERVIPLLAVQYFDDPNLKRLFIIMLEFINEYGKVPNLQNKSIHQAINKFKTANNKIEEELLFSVLKRVELWNERVLNAGLLHDGDIIQKETNNFIKQQEYRKIGEHIIGKTKTGAIKDKAVIGEIEEMFVKASHIGEEVDDCEEVIDNIERALRKEFRQTIATGVEVIDALTGGGLGKGEFGLILTPSGVGKTTLLTKIANTAYEDGKYVAQIIFEDTKDQIKRKHYTIWSGIAQSKIDDNRELVLEKVREKVIEIGGSGKLVIKKFSQENTTIKDIRKWMASYQKKHGFKFELLVLDYLDCVEPNTKNSDRNEAELMIVKSFEALASDFDIPCWSAIQSGRSGINAEYVEAYQSGGSIKRLQKSHFFMSVAKTPEQKEADLANIRILKARFAKDGQTFNDCIFNNDTMEIRIEDDRYKHSKFSKGKKHHDSEDIDKIESELVKMHSTISQYSQEALAEKVNNDSLFDNLREKIQANKDFDNPVIAPEPVIEITNEIETPVVEFEVNNEIVVDEDIVEEVSKINEIIEEKSIDDIENSLIDPDSKPEKHLTVHEMLMESRKNQQIKLSGK